MSEQLTDDERARRLAALQARDLREQRLHRALDDRIRSAFCGNLAAAARECIAEEDYLAMVDALVGALDAANLCVVDRDDLAAYLRSHEGNEDSGQWQDGHDYAMREAARLVEGAWDQIKYDQHTPSPSPGADRADEGAQR